MSDSYHALKRIIRNMFVLLYVGWEVQIGKKTFKWIKEIIKQLFELTEYWKRSSKPDRPLLYRPTKQFRSFKREVSQIFHGIYHTSNKAVTSCRKCGIIKQLVDYWNKLLPGWINKQWDAVCRIPTTPSHDCDEKNYTARMLRYYHNEQKKKKHHEGNGSFSVCGLRCTFLEANGKSSATREKAMEVPIAG